VTNGAPVEDLTVDELRRLLVEKRRIARQERLDHFRRTGRVVVLAADVDNSSLESLRTDISTETERTPSIRAKRSRWKRIFDGVLLTIEILAVAGLLYVLLNGVDLIRKLSKEAVSAFVQPTLIPTPLIVAVVLPSGHTSPNAPGGARPNDVEIPEHLRPLVQSLANIAIPTAGPAQATRIQIEAILVDAPIVQGDGWEQLKKGVGQNIGSANPGENGNVVLSAHDDIFGEIFRYLDRLKPGDKILIYTNQNVHTYIVTGSKIVEPTQVEVMGPTSQPTLTLISCYPYLVDNMRIVVTARLQNDG
jgi:sortase A